MWKSSRIVYLKGRNLARCCIRYSGQVDALFEHPLDGGSRFVGETLGHFDIKHIIGNMSGFFNNQGLAITSADYAGR